MNRYARIFCLLSVLLLALLSSQCGMFGTDTGNPSRPLESPSDSDMGQTQITDALILEVCEAIDNCYDGVDLDTCENSLQMDVNALASFGANTEKYNSFEKIQMDIDDGVLVVNVEDVELCVQKIESETCISMRVWDAFNENNPDDFSEIYRVIPKVECGKLFD